MSFHGMQLLGISIVLAALALGQQTSALVGGGSVQSLVYVPNSAVAIVGVVVTVVGILADPVVEVWLRRFTK
jgi:hypothetical protein